MEAHLLHLSHALLTLDLSFASLLLFAGGLLVPLDAPSGVLDASSVAVPVEGLPVTWTHSDDACGRDAPSKLLSMVHGVPSRVSKSTWEQLEVRWKIIRWFPGWTLRLLQPIGWLLRSWLRSEERVGQAWFLDFELSKRISTIGNRVGVSARPEREAFLGVRIVTETCARLCRQSTVKQMAGREPYFQSWTFHNLRLLETTKQKHRNRNDMNRSEIWLSAAER